MLKSTKNFCANKNTTDIDQWEDDGGFIVCVNSAEKRHAASSAPRKKPYSGMMYPSNKRFFAPAQSFKKFRGVSSNA